MNLTKAYTFTTVAFLRSKNVTVAVITQNREHQLRIDVDKTNLFESISPEN